MCANDESHVILKIWLTKGDGEMIIDVITITEYKTDTAHRI